MWVNVFISLVSVQSGSRVTGSYSKVIVTVSQVAQTVKNVPANAGHPGSIPGSGKSPGGGHGKPLEYSCLVNPMDRGAWWTTVHGVAKSQT